MSLIQLVLSGALPPAVEDAKRRISTPRRREIEMSRHDSDYLEHDPFCGDEGDLTCRNAAIRTARKEYPCFGGIGGDGHTIKPGDRYRYETARVDGDFWGTYRICLPCIDKWIRELEGDSDDE